MAQPASYHLVESQLDAEGADPKRVLRAASVLGDRSGGAK
jgi:hypothetical protein